MRVARLSCRQWTHIYFWIKDLLDKEYDLNLLPPYGHGVVAGKAESYHTISFKHPYLKILTHREKAISLNKHQITYVGII